MFLGISPATAAAASDYTIVSGATYGKDTYYGIVHNGKPDVFGVLANKSTGLFYIGGFKDGEYHTYTYEKDGSQSSVPAILLNSDGRKWWGGFKEGYPHGDDIVFIDEYANPTFEMQYRDGKAIARGASYEGLNDYYFKVKYVDDDVSGVSKIELYKENTTFNRDDLYAVVKMSPNGSLSINIDLDDKYRLAYDKSTGNWKYESYIGTLNDAPLAFDWYSDASGEVGFYSGEFFDARYNSNGARMDGRTEAFAFQKSVNNDSGTSTGGGGSGSINTRTLCTFCTGAGKRICFSCDGSGKKYTNAATFYGTRETYVNCTSCAGRGIKTCTSCGGKGYS
jgi:hypothetical protein